MNFTKKKNNVCYLNTTKGLHEAKKIHYILAAELPSDKPLPNLYPPSPSTVWGLSELSDWTVDNVTIQAVQYQSEHSLSTVHAQSEQSLNSNLVVCTSNALIFLLIHWVYY